MGRRTNKYDGLDRYAVRLIRWKARTLIGHAGFVSADREDLEQDLVIDLLARLPRFDPAKGSRKTFIYRVVDHQIATILEQRSAECRDVERCEGSLNDEELVEDHGEVCTRGEVLEEAYFRRVGDLLRTEESRADLRRDLKRVLADVPLDLVRLCTLLLEDANIGDIARKTGIPRSTLYDALGRLRAHLHETGLSDYLEKPPDSSGPRPVGEEQERCERQPACEDRR